MPAQSTVYKWREISVRQVVYVSSGTCDFGDADLKALLDRARENNRLSGVTGVLFYLSGNFIQLIEGEVPAVTETLNKIRLDKRHRNIIQLSDRRVTERSFPEFQMGFKAGIEADLARDPNFLALTEGRLPNGSDTRLGIIFDTFLRINGGRSI